MTMHLPYPSGTVWTYRGRARNFERRSQLNLYYEVSGSTLTDNYTPDERNAKELWGLWYPEYVTDGTARISWSIRDEGGTGLGSEFAPFLDPGMDDFLTFYTWPEHAKTGEPVNWARLAVQDRQWNAEKGDKGGFIQELTGWKPSPFERTFQADLIARAAGLME